MSCQICGKGYTNESCKWCKPCWINNLKNDFTNWTSGNEKIDDFIQEMQLKINGPRDVILEWIPYNQFVDIKENGKSDSATIYSATWKDGQLEYSYFDHKYKRESVKKFVLKKHLHNSQDTNEFLNEV